MESNFFRKIYRLLIAAFIFLSMVTTGNSQIKSKVDFKYKVDSVQVAGQYQYNIHIKVTNGEGPFTVSVFENLRSDLKLLEKKENILNETTITLTERRPCIIYVQNSSMSAVKQMNYK